jgi:hypothetical protein
VQADLTRLLCAEFAFEGVIRGFLKWQKMAQKRLKFEQNRGKNAIFEACGAEFAPAACARNALLAGR